MIKYLVTFILVLPILFVGCNKQENMEKEPRIIECYVVERDNVITFKWMVDYPGKIASIVEISQNEDMKDVVRIGSEIYSDSEVFCVTTSSLIDTKYYYRYLMWNPYISLETEVKKLEVHNLDDVAFSVSPSKEVVFSQGNLQYQASTNTWRFAIQQYDFVGGTVDNEHAVEYGNSYGNVFENEIRSSNNDVSSNYNGWIDLFAWGTSGIPHGANCYQPWSISTEDADFCAYGSSSCNLFDQTGTADWGYNFDINYPGRWRTLTKEEWVYVMNERSTRSGLRYVKALVGDVEGVALFPDNWSNNYSLNSINTEDADYSSNSISVENFLSLFEKEGVAFLPAAGSFVPGDTKYYREGHGCYWSSSTCDYDGNNYWQYKVPGLFFNHFQLASECYGDRAERNPVRLVRDVE